MKIKLFFIFIIISVFISGCEKPPLAEMDSAREAVFRAENDADAVQYAGGTLERARDALRRMQAEADSKRYDAARTLAEEAITAAEKAISDGKAGAQRAAAESAALISSVRSEIEDTAALLNETAALISGLRSEIDETTSNVSSARYALMALDYDDLERRIINAHNTADRAEVDNAAGRYQDAIEKARAVRAELAIINQMVANAVPIVKK